MLTRIDINECFTVKSQLGRQTGKTSFLSWTEIKKMNAIANNVQVKEFKGTLSGLRQFLASESPLKMMKSAFYFTSKALFILKIFKFLPWRSGHVGKRFDKKDKVNFKFYHVTAWLTTIVIHMLPNIWRSKGNQTKKFDQ